MKCCNLIIKTCALLIVLGIMPIVTSAQKANADSIYNAMISYNKTGMVLIAKGDKSAGLKEFGNAISAYSDYDYWVSNRDSTLKIFEKLERENPESPAFKLILAKHIWIIKRDSVSTAKAIEITNKVIAMEPKFARAYSFLATMASNENRNEDALKYYLQAHDVEPDNFAYYYYVSTFLKKLNKEKDAEEWNEKLLKKDSLNSYSMYIIMDRAQNEKDFKAKYSLFTKAIRLAPKDDKEMPLSYFISFLTKEAPDSSIAFCKRLLKSEYAKERKMRLRLIQEIFDNYSKVHKELVPAYAEENFNVDSPRLMQAIGFFYDKELKDKKTALKYFLKGYEIAAPATVLNTYAFGGGGNMDEFLSKVAREVKEGSFALSIGKLYYELKDYNNAEKYLRESIPENIKRKSNTAMIYLGYTLSENGKKEEAVEWLSKGIAMKSDKDAETKLKELSKELKLSLSGDDLVKKTRMKEAKSAPDFTLKNLDGGTVQLSKLKGKVVMLDFWGTWCGPCVSELPQLVKLYEKYKDNKDIIFFGVDINEQPPVIKSFMKEKGYSFNVLLADNTTTSKDYGVSAVPTKFIIDKEGKIQFSHLGADPKEDVVEMLSKQIDELLKMN